MRLRGEIALEHLNRMYKFNFLGYILYNSDFKIKLLPSFRAVKTMQLQLVRDSARTFIFKMMRERDAL